jgi:crossover junction endodeoxyribonuclease RusA
MKPWRQDVAWTAKEAMRKAGHKVWTRPMAIKVTATFYFPVPKSKKGRVHGYYKTTKPDIDKILRGLLDSLTDICYEDDAQVSSIEAEKWFATTPHTVVYVEVLQ